ncbi:hypothetical protein P4U44_09085, partial [Alkalihalobacillus alcalophilus]|nr:hypothetical protein [Alkalihalobacillus alcalophilus]
SGNDKVVLSRLTWMRVFVPVCVKKVVYLEEKNLGANVLVDSILCDANRRATSLTSFLLKA